jgi:hypothetical protein
LPDAPKFIPGNSGAFGRVAKACCVHLGLRNPLYTLVLGASSRVQIFHLNAICSHLCFASTFTRSDFPSERDLL